MFIVYKDFKKLTKATQNGRNLNQIVKKWMKKQNRNDK